jgi:hypothetical protein
MWTWLQPNKKGRPRELLVLLTGMNVEIMKVWNWNSSVRLPVDLALACLVFGHLHKRDQREQANFVNCSIIPIDHINIATSKLTFDSFSFVAQGVCPQGACSSRSGRGALPVSSVTRASTSLQGEGCNSRLLSLWNLLH